MANKVSLRAVDAPPKTAAQVTTWAELRAALCARFPEREEVIDAMFAALLAGEHVFLLGPAGTGKSALARSVAQAFAAPYFEALITKFTTPGEIFGEVDLPAWQRTGVYTRNVSGFLPEAHVVFLDEVWKGSSAILNALLTMLNERKYRNGGSLVSLPLRTCVSASNELPDGEGLDPIYDRFLVRYEVRYLVERDAWLDMIQAPDPVAPSCTLDLDAEQAACAAVTVSPAIYAAAWEVRGALQKLGFVVSDRRWKRAIKLVQARAYLDGRTSCEIEDLDILEHALWREPKERTTIARTIQEKCNPAGAACVERLDEARDLWAKLPADIKSAPTPVHLGELGGCLDALDKLSTSIDALPSGRKVIQARAEVGRIRNEVAALTTRAMGIKL